MALRRCEGFPVWLLLSFHLLTDKVNNDNKYHRGVVHTQITSMPHLLGGNLYRVHVRTANQRLCNEGGYYKS